MNLLRCPGSKIARAFSTYTGKVIISADAPPPGIFITEAVMAGLTLKGLDFTIQGS